MGKGIFRLRWRIPRGPTAEIPGAPSKSPRQTDRSKRGAILRRCRRQPLTREAFWWLQAPKCDQGSLSQASFRPIDAVLGPTTGLRLQDILGRIGNDQPMAAAGEVAAAGKVAAPPSQWWRWCRSLLGCPQSEFRRSRRHRAAWRRQPRAPGEDDIEGGFRGAPGWLRRS